MTMPGEEPEQEAVLASLEEAAAMEETETLVGHSSLDEEEEEEEEKRENERHRRRRQEQQQQQAAASGMEQLTYSRMTHLLAVYQNKVQEGRRVIASLRRQKDSQLQAVISQLLLLEARLRREQKGIVGQLAQRDHVIAAQRQEIDRLRRDNRRLINRLKKVSEACETECREPRLKVSRVEAEEGAMPGPAGHAAPASSSPPGRRSSPGVIRVATSVSELISSGGGKDQRSPGKSPPCVYQVSGRGGSGGGGQRPPPPVNPNVALVRATTDRVFHKPPIAEKPRTAAGRPGRGQAPSQRAQHIVRSHNGKCTIVSTISRLLEEESDATTTGSSEPSSPEATLKPPTPRVIRLARHFEESLAPHQQPAATQAGPTESPDPARRDDRSSKSYIMDEYEVTSGYNSDAVSDHEYENIQVVSCREPEVGKLHQNSHSLSRAKDEGAHEAVDGDKAEREQQQEEDEEEDNYVILRAVTENPDSGHWVDIPDDQHIYSNVEFSSGLLIKEIEEEEEEAVAREKEESQRSPEEARNTRRNLRNRCEGEMGQGVLETNLDASPSAPASDGHHSSHVENLRAVKSVNVPRSRHNINLIMESDGDHMTENFEEFTLDSLELEEEQEREEEAADRGRGKENLPVHELRRCGDGAETKDGRSKEVQREAVESLGVASPSNYGSGQYEKFLEATGLSQKSILTPTRMFSNHRSVLKPRDIKHRNKLRAAFTTLSTLEEAPGPTGGSRYWTEPYL
ncbi:uncharacterized protein LOC123502714 [Portunus trituberculatus]|uniref:uncharacterized protein LOC123502714 n=1 Tax=Portunus trituberculatus TaxID=210409 RepID=UPI001E1D1F1E|nr:uncharacterized protein LOC123502714 [Portunus trituberculatus]XP_045107872.1 uncharacterized protein LOC123502714 [Portunus trituberculatus]XP_045107873.1 uncharacterized protein LOC123502714 [Portunus trituberculatus]